MGQGFFGREDELASLMSLHEPLVGRMLHYDGLRGRFDEFEVPRDPGCPACAVGYRRRQ